MHRVDQLAGPRFCPVCDRESAEFLPFGLIPRPEARCPLCGSLERHRLIWMFFERWTNLFGGAAQRMLHVAPESCLEPKLREIQNIDYLTADLTDPHAMVRMDLTAIQYGDESFDVIHCSHVLEHVPDDRKAMRELRRVLTPGGWATIMVPITAEKTVEDPSITDPQERERLFGQHDHVRRYGPDVIDRLEAAGFKVRRFTGGEVVGKEDVSRMRISDGEEVLLCTR